MSIALLSPDSLLKQVDAQRLQATVEKLASWHDRNTNNPTLDEAAEWIAGELRKNPNLKVEIMRYPVKQGQRIKEDKEVVQVVATLPGATDRRVVIGGHFDTINMTGATNESWVLPSPGANDDASGVALTLECARILSQEKWNQTLVFVAFSGEEQGLLGSTALAARAKSENWNIDAVLSNDMVGNSRNNLGQSDPHHIRVFSEDGMNLRPAAGGQPAPSHHSRDLARFVEFITRNQVKDFNVKLVFRADRFGRGGDHTPFNRQGINAVRFVEPNEEYSHQHTPEDLPKHMDWGFLANSTRVNLLTAMTLASAEPPPTNIRIDRAQGHDTTITWSGATTSEYVVYWRETTSAVWQFSKRVGPVNKVTIDKVSKDDYVFAVGVRDGVPVEAQ